jgi:hypothetical protein
MADQPDLQFLEKLTYWRNDAQVIQFKLLKLVTEKQEELRSNETHNLIFQLMLGIAFSLWRAVFLGGEPLEPVAALADAKVFVKNVVSDNAIGYAQEQLSKRWVSGFYASHIQYRMFHLNDQYAETLKVEELVSFVQKYSPFAPQASPTKKYEFFDDAVVCLNALVDRLTELLD